MQVLRLEEPLLFASPRWSVASAREVIQIISVMFSFSWLFAKLTSKDFRHHKKLLQADIYVCKPNVNHTAVKTRKYFTF